MALSAMPASVIVKVLVYIKIQIKLGLVKQACLVVLKGILLVK